MLPITQARKDIPIKPRHPDFNVSDELAGIWVQHEDGKLAIFLTVLMNSLSILFPEGERFFIRSVRDYKDQISDPALKQDVRSFIEQEGQHTREHHKYNQALKQRGYDVDKLEKIVKKRIELGTKMSSKEQQLAATSALEHFTAVLAEYLLTSPHISSLARPNMKAMWQWHAVEEIEHKAVAFDVYKQCVNKEFPRKRIFFSMTIALPFDTIRNMIHMFRKEKVLFDLKMWYRGWKYLATNLFPIIVPKLKAYYAKDFHPWNEDSSSLINDWKNQYEDAEGNMLSNF